MNSITNLSLIKGVFREIAALRRPVFVFDSQGKHQTYISIVDDFSRSSIAENSIRLELFYPPENGNELEITFELDNASFRCVLKRSLVRPEEFCLPSFIEPDQKRRRRRTEIQSLSKEPVVVEARGKLWRGYGYLKNSDLSHIAATFSIFGQKPTIDEAVSLRAYTQGTQVFSSIARITTIRPDANSNRVELLFSTHGAEERPKRSETIRSKTGVLTFLEVTWPTQDGLRIRVEVLEVTSTGFSAKILGEQQESLPRGAICQILNSEILVQLMWQQDDRLGFDLSLNDRRTLAHWGTWIDEWQLKVLNRTPNTRQQSRIASVLIRSGYLRDFKASVFASTPDVLSLIPNGHQNRAWIKRFLRGTETDLDAHVSFARCTDTSWIIQELGNSAINTRFGEEILLESMEAFYNQERPYLTYGGTLLALFDPLSKFNQSFWLNREATAGIVSLDCSLLNIGPALNRIIGSYKSKDSLPIKITTPSIETWSKNWNELSKWLPQRVLYALGFQSDDYANCELRQTLAQSGYQMDRRIGLITISEELVGCFVSMGIPTFSNLNATSSHLWVILKDANLWKTSIQGIFSSECPVQLHGTTEAVITTIGSISIDEEDNSISAFIKKRKLFLIPISSIPNFLKQGQDAQQS